MTKVEIRTLAQVFDGNPKKPTYSQNGVKFRTICASCNNDKLGGKYDPELIKLCNDVSQFLRAKVETDLIFPQKRSFIIKPQRVARAIVGHLIAGCMPDKIDEPIGSAPRSDALRNFFLNEDQPLPASIDIYYWLYPADAQLIMNHFSFVNLGTKSIMIASLIKFFPFAFMVTWDKPLSIKLPHGILIKEKKLWIDDMSAIDIDFRIVPPVNWPESPESQDGEYFVIFIDAATTFSMPKSFKAG